MTAFYPITNGTTADVDGYFAIPGNFVGMFTPGFTFVVIDSGSGSPTLTSAYTLTVASSLFDGANTQITPTASPGIVTPNGQYVSLVGGGYSIQYEAGVLIISPGNIDYTTCLGIPGRAVFNYGEVVGQDIISLLENFAGSTPPCGGTPNTALKGQLWFDTVAAAMKVWNGSAWVGLAASGNGVGYFELVAVGGETAIATPAINTQAKGAGVAYQQVYLNGILLREDAAAGYTVTGANQITINAPFAPLTAADELVIYQV